jgi:hypothetical protein
MENSFTFHLTRWIVVVKAPTVVITCARRHLRTNIHRRAMCTASFLATEHRRIGAHLTSCLPLGHLIWKRSRSAIVPRMPRPIFHLPMRSGYMTPHRSMIWFAAILRQPSASSSRRSTIFLSGPKRSISDPDTVAVPSTMELEHRCASCFHGPVTECAAA